MTTAGLHRRGDRAFGPGEQTFRVIPAARRRRTSSRATRASASTACRSCATSTSRIPIDRLRELVARGELGGSRANQLLVHGRAARDLDTHRERDRPRGRAAASRGRSRRRAHHPHLTVLHARRRCAGARARSERHRHDLDQSRARAHGEDQAAARALRPLPVRPRARASRTIPRSSIACCAPRSTSSPRRPGRSSPTFRTTRSPATSRRRRDRRPRSRRGHRGRTIRWPRCASFAERHAAVAVEERRPHRVRTERRCRRRASRTWCASSSDSRTAPTPTWPSARPPSPLPGIHPLVRRRSEDARVRGLPGDRRRRRAATRSRAGSGERPPPDSSCARVRDRLDASDDPKWKAAAFGVAR